MTDEITFFTRLIAEWRAIARPMILADEVRIDDPTHKEIVAFVFVCTDTRTATQFADEATALRSRMSQAYAGSLIKGSHLYGNNPPSSLNDFRTYVESAIARCPIIVRVTTTSPTITRHKSISPGGIRRKAASENRRLTPVTGRELVPFMNMLKLTATAMKAADAQVDVLLDRSFNLGLDPRQLGIDENDVAILGPGPFNECAGGIPASFNCPSSFQLICPPKHSAFRDLLLLPDAAAYRMRPNLPAMRDDLARTGFRVDIFPSAIEQELFATLATSFPASAAPLSVP